MNSRKLVVRETLTVAAGEAAVALLTAFVYALIKKLTAGVWLGALAGAVLATLNYFLMARTLSRAGDQAVNTGQSEAGRGSVRVSYTLRLILLFVILAVLAKARVIEPIPAVIPLVLMQPVIILALHMQKRLVK